MSLRIVGGVIGSVLGASAMSVYKIGLRNTTLDFDNYTRYLSTPQGLVGAVAGGVVGMYPDYVIPLILPNYRFGYT